MAHPQPLALHTRRYGTKGSPLIVLHGLLGSARNWHSIATALATSHRVITADLRNHGQSPHSALMDYPHLVADIEQLVRQEGGNDVRLLGHSLGGKVAMAFALKNPRLLASLIVVDIAPLADRDRYSPLLRALGRAPLATALARSEIDRHLQSEIRDPVLRQFLLMNLDRSTEGYRWRVNIDGLLRAMPQLLSFPRHGAEARFDGPTLFVVGARSDYAVTRQRPIIEQLFPNARISLIENAGHWPHIDAPSAFIQRINTFLAGG